MLHNNDSALVSFCESRKNDNCMQSLTPFDLLSIDATAIDGEKRGEIVSVLPQHSNGNQENGCSDDYESEEECGVCPLDSTINFPRLSSLQTNPILSGVALLEKPSTLLADLHDYQVR